MNENRKDQPVDDMVQEEREERRRLWFRIIRWSIAIPLILFSYPRLGLLGIFLTMLSAILIAPDIISFLSQFAGRLFWPRQPPEPRPLYSIPESLVAKGRYMEAEREYEKIIQEFPNEVKPHLDMIDIAVVRLNDGQLAEQLFQRGLSLLRGPADRDTLSKAYAGIRSRLKTPESMKTQTIPYEKIIEVKARLERDRPKLWR